MRFTAFGPPAGLVRRRPGRKRLHGEKLLAALNCVYAGAGQRERSRGPRYSHPDRDDEGLRDVAQLLHRVRQQSLENTPTLPDGLRDEVAVGEKTWKPVFRTKTYKVNFQRVAPETVNFGLILLFLLGRSHLYAEDDKHTRDGAQEPSSDGHRLLSPARRVFVLQLLYQSPQ